jgi:hypothetical protein
MTILKCLMVWLLVAFFYKDSHCQPHAKVFAYEQSVLPGTVPAGVTNEEGAPVKTPRVGVSTTFHIYFAHDLSSGVKPVSLWIKGRSLQFTPEAASPPVLQHVPGNPRTLTLVPRTSMSVSRLVVTGESAKQPTLSTSLKKKLGASEVVVGYTWKGKTYYAALKNINVLEPLMNQ